jgi:hypothetical protein
VSGDRAGAALDPMQLTRTAAELVVAAPFATTNRKAWITVTPIAIATTAIQALIDGGWTLIPPKVDPMVCPKCGQRWKIKMRDRSPVGPPAPYHYCDCEATTEAGAGLMRPDSDGRCA